MLKNLSLTGIRKLSGSTVSGIYLYAVLSSYFHINEHIQIGLQINVPRIASLTSTNVDAFSPEKGNHVREYVEQLLPYQMSVSVPIFGVVTRNRYLGKVQVQTQVKLQVCVCICTCVCTLNNHPCSNRIIACFINEDDTTCNPVLPVAIVK